MNFQRFPQYEKNRAVSLPGFPIKKLLSIPATLLHKIMKQLPEKPFQMIPGTRNDLIPPSSLWLCFSVLFISSRFLILFLSIKTPAASMLIVAGSGIGGGGGGGGGIYLPPPV